MIEGSVIAAIFAVSLALLFVWRRQRSAAIASAAWAIYCGYEYLMYTRVFCTGECNIRVDLLLMYPILIVLTLYAVIRNIRSRPSRRDGSTDSATA